MTDDARTVVDSYFAAWKNNDFASMRAVLDDRLDFAGPVDRFDRADAYQQAVAGLSRMKTDIVIRKTFVAGSDVLTWYDLHTTVAAPAPVAEWSHVEHGKITMVRVVFDARPFSPPADRWPRPTQRPPPWLVAPIATASG